MSTRYKKGKRLKAKQCPICGRERTKNQRLRCPSGTCLPSKPDRADVLKPDRAEVLLAMLECMIDRKFTHEKRIEAIEDSLLEAQHFGSELAASQFDGAGDELFYGTEISEIIRLRVKILSRHFQSKEANHAIHRRLKEKLP